jgi:Cellulose binding domain
MKLSRRARSSLCVAFAAAVVTAGAFGAPFLSLPAAHAAAATCDVRYQVRDDWGAGATVDVTVTDTGPAIDHWLLAWTFPGNQRITNGWNGTYSQSGAAVSVSNVSYNGTLASGGSTGTGFSLTYSGANTPPASFTVNGQACTSNGQPAPSASASPSASPSRSPSPSPSPTTSPTNSPTTSPTVSPTGSPNPGRTGNATYFDALGQPYGGCGLPQSELDSQNFVALNVYNTPGDYTTFYPRPMPASLGSKVGAWDNGRNCGRFVQVTIGDYCTGTNDGAPNQPFCRNGSWVSDQYDGATLTMVVADSCGDGNAWCRDDPNHLDLAKGSLNAFVKNGAAVGDMYPNHWNNRRIQWQYVPPPGYTGDIRIGFMQSAQRYWPAIAVTHLPNGIHGVEYQVNGAWQAAQPNADMGQAFIIGATQSGGTTFQIRIRDASDQLLNGGRTYTFSLPASCAQSCGGPFTAVTYTTG